jgi:hypothetical protein
MEDKSCTKSPFIEISGDKMRISPIEAEPIEGYEVPADFPNCCPHHKQAFANAQNWFDKFPNCCELHIEAAKKWHLKKSEFDGLPQKILNGLSYTEHHISKRIDIPEWYEDITNYIDYICWCFGHPAIGVDRYITFLKHYLTVTKEKIPKDKREKLLQYLESENKPSDPDEASKFDLNILFDTYQKWLKTFPFELPYFDGLKERLKGAIPVLKEAKKQNPYTGMWKAKGVTQAELIDLLEVTTKRLIGDVQTHDFQISDMKQHRLKIENERLRVGTAELVRGYLKKELKYVTTIKKWLELQKQYFKAFVEIAGNDTKAESSKPLKTRPTFAGLFENDEAMGKALLAARNCGLINEKGRWIFVGAKTFAASAFWKAAVTSGLGKADMAKASVSKAIGEHFRIGLGKNAIRIDTGEFDQGLYTNLLAAMKSTK